MTSVRTVGARVAAGVVVGLLGLLALPAPPAAAHATLTGSDPKDGGTIETLPDQVELDFSEEVGSPAYVEVTASDGTQVADGEPEVLGATVTVPLVSEGPSGSYTIAFRVVSADGHPISAELRFDVTTGPPPGQASEPATSPEASDAADASDNEEGFFSRHVGHFAVAGVGLVAGALLVGAGLQARR